MLRDRWTARLIHSFTHSSAKEASLQGLLCSRHCTRVKSAKMKKYQFLPWRSSWTSDRDRHGNTLWVWLMTHKQRCTCHKYRVSFFFFLKEIKCCSELSPCRASEKLNLSHYEGSLPVLTLCPAKLLCFFTAESMWGDACWLGSMQAIAGCSWSKPGWLLEV